MQEYDGRSTQGQGLRKDKIVRFPFGGASHFPICIGEPFQRGGLKAASQVIGIWPVRYLSGLPESPARCSCLSECMKAAIGANAANCRFIPRLAHLTGLRRKYGFGFLQIDARE